MSSIFNLKQLATQPVTSMVTWLPNLEQIFATKRILEPEEATQVINPKTQKLLAFWGYELIEQAKSATNFDDRTRILTEFFFDHLQFKVIPKSNLVADDTAPILFSQVVSQRSGPPMLVGLVYCFLAEQIGIKAGWVSLDKPMIIKTMLASESRFVDLSNKCSGLMGQEVVELASETFSSGLHFSLIDARSFCEHYLKHVLTRLLVTHQVRRCITLLNFLNAMEPNHLYFLKKRAFLFFEIGEFERSLEDVKTYKFHSAQEHLPMDLDRLRARALAAVERKEVQHIH